MIFDRKFDNVNFYDRLVIDNVYYNQLKKSSTKNDAQKFYDDGITAHYHKVDRGDWSTTAGKITTWILIHLIDFFTLDSFNDRAYTIKEKFSGLEKLKGHRQYPLGMIRTALKQGIPFQTIQACRDSVLRGFVDEEYHRSTNLVAMDAYGNGCYRFRLLKNLDGTYSEVTSHELY